MKWIIDRFEGEYAVCELPNGKMVDIPKSAIPDDSREGDVIVITIDENETDKRKDRIDGLMNSLFKN